MLRTVIWWEWSACLKPESYSYPSLRATLFTTHKGSADWIVISKLCLFRFQNNLAILKREFQIAPCCFVNCDSKKEINVLITFQFKLYECYFLFLFFIWQENELTLESFIQTKSLPKNLRKTKLSKKSVMEPTLDTAKTKCSRN